jgi:hypothetical protein
VWSKFTSDSAPAKRRARLSEGTRNDYRLAWTQIAKTFGHVDLRAHYATVHKQQHGVLPDLHKNPRTTARVYDRNKAIKRSAL